MLILFDNRREFCELFKHVKKETEAKWPGKVAYYQPIGGLFFLRFINAALVSPNFFGLIKGIVLLTPVMMRIVLMCDTFEQARSDSDRSGV